MKLFTSAFCLASFALVAFAAPSYKVTLTEPSVIAGSAVKPGDYKIVVNGDKATLTSGRTSLEVPVKVQSGSQKFPYTSIEGLHNQGQNVVEDIHVGGTTTTLVFSK